MPKVQEVSSGCKIHTLSQKITTNEHHKNMLYKSMQQKVFNDSQKCPDIILLENNYMQKTT